MTSAGRSNSGTKAAIVLVVVPVTFMVFFWLVTFPLAAVLDLLAVPTSRALEIGLTTFGAVGGVGAALWAARAAWPKSPTPEEPLPNA